MSRPDSILLKNGMCVELSPAAVESADVRVSDGVVVERGRGLVPGEGETVEDLSARILMPGLVCAHTHLYSSLARGMPAPLRAPRNFLEILQTIWWRLDRALDAETIYCSAVAGALEAARCGVTTIIDHHASPNAVEGSLKNVRKGVEEIGLRGILCYETSDRDGVERRDRGLAENEDFLKSCRSEEMFRGLAGGHASFTLSDDSLRKLGEIAERFGTGVHLHVAEGDSDPKITQAKYGRTVLDRLEEFGILRRNSLLAHCIHLGAVDFARIRDSGAWLVHNPRSNMHNRVGQAPLGEFGERKALGTDGFPPDMFEELRAAYFRGEEVREGVDWVGMLANGHLLVSEIFGRRFGAIRKGAPADLVVLDYQSPTPVTAHNFPSHFLFGFRSSMVESVMVNGRWVVHRRQIPGKNEQELVRGARRAAKRLWSLMDALPA
jgi:putative selenium metabolism protein SsnA